MITIQLCFLITFYHFIFIESQSENFDVKWDDELMKQDPDFKCGIQDKYQEEQSARIINGALINDNKYAWKADIFRVTFNSDDTFYKQGKCSGSVISEKVILTAAHCLCKMPKKLDKNGDPPIKNAICKEVFWKYIPKEESPEKLQLRNQNNLHNQIHYSVGPKSSLLPLKKFKKDLVANFKESIKAFIHKYEPKWWEEGTVWERMDKAKKWKNGDIGVIIDEDGLNLKAKKAIPVCLPVPNTFKNEFEVTAAGTGRVYGEYEDKTVTSCMTNEGVVRKSGTQYSNTQSGFLQCKNYDRNKKDSCTSLKDATVEKNNKESKGYTSNWLSTDVEVIFSTPNNLKIKIPNNDECESLGPKIERAKNKDFIMEDRRGDDGRGPTRIVVFDDDDKVKDWREKYRKWDRQSSPNVPYCYNLHRLHRGICETEDPLYNFGFCSSSCVLPNPVFKFWMDMKADFHDNDWYSATEGEQSKHRQLP